MRRGLETIVVIFGALLIVVALSTPQFMAEKTPVSPVEELARKAYVHVVVEGLTVQCGAFAKRDLLRIGSCRVEKQSKGGFSFGAFNILIIDDLEVVLPSSNPTHRGLESVADALKHDTGMDGIANELRMLIAQYPKFSSLRINDLSVGRLDPSGGYRSILLAECVEAGWNRTLRFNDCEFLTTNGERIRCKHATLSFENPTFLNTDRGSFPIHDAITDFNESIFNLTPNRARPRGIL